MGSWMSSRLPKMKKWTVLVGLALLAPALLLAVPAALNFHTDDGAGNMTLGTGYTTAVMSSDPTWTMPTTSAFTGPTFTATGAQPADPGGVTDCTYAGDGWVCEGATDDGLTITWAVVDPTAVRSIVWGDMEGTVQLESRGGLRLTDATVSTALTMTNPAGTHFGIVDLTENEVQGAAWMTSLLTATDPCAGAVDCDQLIIGADGEGRYLVNTCTSFSHDRNGVVIHGHVFLNQASTELQWKRSINTVGAIGTACTTGILDLVVGDDLDFRIEQDLAVTGPSDILTILEHNLTLTRIGDT